MSKVASSVTAGVTVGVTAEVTPGRETWKASEAQTQTLDADKVGNKEEDVLCDLILDHLPERRSMEHIL